MANDRERAHELSDNGLLFGDGIAIASGASAPTHSATNGDWYVQTVPVVLWKRVEGSWVQLIDCILQTSSSKPTFHTSGANNGELDFIEFYIGLTQITANRRSRVDMTYDASLNPTSEIWKIYDVNGTSILNTFTITHVWSGVDLVRSEGVLT